MTDTPQQIRARNQVKRLRKNATLANKLFIEIATVLNQMQANSIFTINTSTGEVTINSTLVTNGTLGNDAQTADLDVTIIQEVIERYLVLNVEYSGTEADRSNREKIDKFIEVV